VKRNKHLFEKVVSFENLLQAAHKASRCKRMNRNVARFNFGLEGELLKLQEELLKKTYRHGRYRQFTIYDPKVRKIAAAPFRDRVVHHAVHDIIEPIIDKTFIYHSYACRKDKGTHKAVDKAQSFLMANRFCFHGDIKKYFHSINHNLLKGIFRMKIDDKDTLWLLDEITDSAVSLQGAENLSPSLRGHEVPEASGLAARQAIPKARLLRRPCSPSRNDGRGLPIGNLTSQFFANLYLNELDRFIKFDLKHRYYIRYMDDFLIFDDDKTALKDVKDKIGKFLRDNLSLELHAGKSQIYRTGNGIKFLGFRISKDYRRLASDNVRRFRKRLKKFACLFENAKMGADEIRDSVRCWAAHAKHANSKKLRFNIWNGLREKNGPFADSLKDILPDGAS
jgi:retron-type reverse transcriptase